MPVTRRALVGSGALLIGEPALNAASATPPSSDGIRRLGRYVKMRGSLDPGLVIGFLSGRYDGMVDGEVTPLFGLEAATFSRYRFRDDGYDIISFEQAYFTDLNTGAVLNGFVNPYTGNKVAAPVTRLPPTKSRIRSDLRFDAPSNLPSGFSLDHWVEPPMRVGAEIIQVEHLKAASVAAPGKRPFRYTESTTLRALVRDIDNPALSRAPCQTSFAAVVSWRPWLNMGDRPGAMLGTGVGRYGASLDDLPRSWLAATAQVRPELLQRPGASLDDLFN